MNIQDWLTRLLSRPTADPLDWESYRVTMESTTWKALWQEIDGSQAYEDGLEVGFRLLEATHQHQARLSPRGYQTNQILLCRSILSMLDKADRWDTYLAAWETIWAQANRDLALRRESQAMGDPQHASFVRRTEEDLAATSPPKVGAMQFLSTQLRRKALIERRLVQESAGKLISDRRPVGRNAPTTEEIRSRLARIGESAG